MINIPSIILISAVELLVFLIFVSSSSKTYALINPLINQVTISREILPSVATSSILAHPNHKVKNETRLTLRTLSSSRNRSRNRNRRKRQLESPSESLTKFSAPSRASSAFKFDPVTSSKEENFHSSSSYTFAPSSSSSSREEGSVRVLDRLNSDPETLYQSINLNSYQVPSSNYHSIPSSFGSSPGGVAANQEFESMSQYFEGRIGHGHRLDPIIDASTPRNITTASGKTVFLPCRIRHLGDRTVGFFFSFLFLVFLSFLHSSVSPFYWQEEKHSFFLLFPFLLASFVVLSPFPFPVFLASLLFFLSSFLFALFSFLPSLFLSLSNIEWK